ncbi:MAG: DoxX family protein [Gemmatimonadales bacterium]|nr:DoxX family protein [Gemmatimonadales bacterium]MBA3554024.1 DoxX family protein [Gemmatimonadales bacterium]
MTGYEGVKESLARSALTPSRGATGGIRSLLRTDADVGPLILRLTLAAVFFPHGAQKMLGWFGGPGFTGEMQFFTETMGIPAVFAFLAIVTEFFGPIGLALGLLGRVAAFGIGCVMVVAALTSHVQHGFFMNWFGEMSAGSEGFEYHLLVLGMVLVIVIKGSGGLSLDRALSRSPEVDSRAARHPTPLR